MHSYHEGTPFMQPMNIRACCYFIIAPRASGRLYGMGTERFSIKGRSRWVRSGTPMRCDVVLTGVHTPILSLAQYPMAIEISRKKEEAVW